ncbi:hypothetical protein A4D02_35515 [Niastella koreensis]|uniref:Uncharacterized protein n=2 Tax=Niastella koreensis TaxID=354356 RepID=G8TJF2_NIAKG|nr:hypothetical protein [Niastella koreensis]AEV99687.1 hypothetical protein Niako_3379 [Niastella koreensis GR20-10]OQP44286.1 hypothetical protein A4D02_35515 [Niastella koreensis]
MKRGNSISIVTSCGFIITATFWHDYIYVYAVGIFIWFSVFTMSPSRKIKLKFKKKYLGYKKAYKASVELFNSIREGNREVSTIIRQKINYNLRSGFIIISTFILAYLIVVKIFDSVPPFIWGASLTVILLFLNSWFLKLIPNLYYTKGLNYPFNKSLRFLCYCYHNQIQFGLFLRDFSSERWKSSESLFNRKFDSGSVSKSFSQKNVSELINEPFFNISMYLPVFGLCNKRDLNPPSYVIPLCSKEKDWFSIVEKLITDAELIIIASNQTSWGLRKELRLIQERNLQNKTIFITDELYFMQRYLEPYRLPHIITLDKFLNNIHFLHMGKYINKGSFGIPLINLLMSRGIEEIQGISSLRYYPAKPAPLHFRVFYRIAAIFHKSDD